MNPIKFRIKPDGLIEIVQGSRFAILNPANTEQVAGNYTFPDEVTTQAFAFAAGREPGERGEIFPS